MQKNEIYTQITIEDVTAEGNGVCHVDGMVVFVPGSVPGDVLDIKIVKVLKRYAFGIVMEVRTPSQDRIEPDCALHKQCGGCLFRHMRYEKELELKAKIVQDAFQRLGGLFPEFLPIIGGTERIRYRNKAQYPVSVNKDGKLVCGFYAERSHRIVPVSDCLLQPKVFGAVVHTVLDYAEKRRISAYCEESNTGILRHIYLRKGYYSDEMMVCLVVRKAIERELRGLIDVLTTQFPQVKSIVMNVNPEQTNVILGKKTVTLWGNDVITDTMCGNVVDISPLSFYQVNTAQAERLYGAAKEFAALTGKERLLDLYCGAGTIGLSMADAAGTVLGVEVIPTAVENARANAVRNGIENAEFLCGDAGKIAQRLAKERMLPDVIVADPPRKGCDEQTLDAICQMNPQRIVMISCNPATAARDCAWLCRKQYQIQKVQPVDLFPGTGHVECVVLMSKVKK